MATNINNKIVCNESHANLDSYYGPYNTVEDAFNALADTIVNGIRAVKLSNMIGNNYNGLNFGYEDEYPRKWVYDNYTPEGITTNNVNSFVQENK